MEQHVIDMASRNHGVRPGYEFRDSVELPGWEQQSIWGWDDPSGSFFAQMWRNGSNSDGPDIWLSGVSVLLPWPHSVALGLVEQLGVDAVTVAAALGIADPAPALRQAEDIRSELALTGAGADLYIRSYHAALAWVVGDLSSSPGTTHAWSDPPTAAEVDAEHIVVTGRVYARPGDAALGGADTALWWALGR